MSSYVYSAVKDLPRIFRQDYVRVVIQTVLIILAMSPRENVLRDVCLDGEMTDVMLPVKKTVWETVQFAVDMITRIYRFEPGLSFLLQD